MTYKYQIGDKVLYKWSVDISKVCECCGHEDYDDKEVKRKGIITARKKEIVYRPQDFSILNDVEVLPSGEIINKPHFADFKVTNNKPEPHYTIGKNSIHENRIIKKL